MAEASRAQGLLWGAWLTSAGQSAARAFRGGARRSMGTEIGDFLEWVDADSGEPPLLKVGLAHSCFVNLHPFDAGNGRIAPGADPARAQRLL
jgi:hypothetical protein